MATRNIFEYATRNKLRFPSPRGELTIEQLWDVPLRSTSDFNLDSVAKAANRALKAASEESFVETEKSPEHLRLEVVLDVVKSVIDTRLAEEERAKRRAENRDKREKLLTALAEKQDGKLSAMSEAALKKQIAELDDED